MSYLTEGHEVTITGHLGADPEMRYTPSGKAVTNISVASTSKWTDQSGQTHERTIWWHCAAWDKQAEICNQYLSKGREVTIKGTMNPDPKTGGPRIWEDQNGKPRASYELTIREIKFHGGRGNGSGEGRSHESRGEQPMGEDEIPF
jgi:single-strand DNA-binding protein